MGIVSPKQLVEAIRYEAVSCAWQHRVLDGRLVARHIHE